MKRIIVVFIIVILTGALTMSLHDRSKDDGNRIRSPRATFTDVQPNDLRMAHGTSQIHNATDTVDDSRISFQERQILVREDSENKAVMGFDPQTGKFAFRVAQDNVDVLTADEDELIFNSSNNLLKIVDSGTVTVTKAANSFYAAVGYTHNLGYTPASLAFVSAGVTKFALPQISWSSGTGEIDISRGIQDINANEIVFEIRTRTSGSNYTSEISSTFTFYLFRETAGL